MCVVKLEMTKSSNSIPECDFSQLDEKLDEIRACLSNGMGVYVIRGVMEPLQCTEAHEAIVASAKESFPNFANGKPHPGSAGCSILTAYGMPQLPVIFDIRNSVCEQVYERLYGAPCSASPDALFLTPNESTRKGPSSLKPHQDASDAQSGEHRNFVDGMRFGIKNGWVHPDSPVEPIQSAINLVDPNVPDDEKNAFVVSTAGLEHQPPLLLKGRAFQQTDLKSYPNLQLQPVYLGAGDLVLWSSKLVHCNKRGRAKRCGVPVCGVPTVLISPEQKEFVLHVVSSQHTMPHNVLASRTTGGAGHMSNPKDPDNPNHAKTIPCAKESIEIVSKSLQIECPDLSELTKSGQPIPSRLKRPLIDWDTAIPTKDGKAVAWSEVKRHRKTK